MSWHIFSLVLACAIGWSILFVGSLPVATVRRLGAEPIKFAGAWAVTAATASPAIFHWYLIFAVICLVAWTKLERPAGKIWLGAAAALGLSLGVIFPLETSRALTRLNDPLGLALLYMGGVTIGQAYLAFLLATHKLPVKPGRVLGLGLSALLWTVLIARFSARFYVRPPFVAPPETPSFSVMLTATWPLLATTLVVPLLALLTWNAARLQRTDMMCRLAIATMVAAVVASLLDLNGLLTAETPPLSLY